MANEKTMYVELKSGYSDNGPAWIGRVKYSKSGRTAYFNGRALKHIKGGTWAGNHEDMQNGDSYWLTGIKKSGSNRHPQGGRGIIEVDKRCVIKLLQLKGWTKLDPNHYRVVDIEDTHPAHFRDIENY